MRLGSIIDYPNPGTLAALWKEADAVVRVRLTEQQTESMGAVLLIGHTAAVLSSLRPSGEGGDWGRLLNVQGFLAAALLVVVSAAARQQPAQPTADFAFRFEFKPCAANTLDRYKNIYIRDMGPNQPSISIPFVLSPRQMVAIYEAIVAIRFFDYPTDFRGGDSGVSESITISPSTTYRLEVRSADVVHTVSWDDAHSPRSVEANLLLNLL